MTERQMVKLSSKEDQVTAVAHGIVGLFCGARQSLQFSCPPVHYAPTLTFRIPRSTQSWCKL
eukprot:1558825-Rhodomonas_salina.1